VTKLTDLAKTKAVKLHNMSENCNLIVEMCDVGLHSIQNVTESEQNVNQPASQIRRLKMKM
jgi:hypothetical protein